MQIDNRHIKAHHGASGQFPETATITSLTTEEVAKLDAGSRRGTAHAGESAPLMRVYTVTDETDMARMIKANVEIIIADYPERWL